MILIPIGVIYAQVEKSATSYYSLIVLPWRPGIGLGVTQRQPAFKLIT